MRRATMATLRNETRTLLIAVFLVNSHLHRDDGGARASRNFSKVHLLPDAQSHVPVTTNTHACSNFRKCLRDAKAQSNAEKIPFESKDQIHAWFATKCFAYRALSNILRRKAEVWHTLDFQNLLLLAGKAVTTGADADIRADADITAFVMAHDSMPSNKLDENKLKKLDEMVAKHLEEVPHDTVKDAFSYVFYNQPKELRTLLNEFSCCKVTKWTKDNKNMAEYAKFLAEDEPLDKPGESNKEKYSDIVDLVNDFESWLEKNEWIQGECNVLAET